MKSHRDRLAAVLAGLLGLSISGCASIMSGGYQRVVIQSNPSEATVRILNVDGLEIFNSRTPAAAQLGRGNGFFQRARYLIILEKPGYRKQRIILESTLNVWYVIGNPFFSGLIGWLIVDPATGAMWTLSPGTIDAKMKEETSFLKTEEGLMIVLLKDVPRPFLELMRPLPIAD